MKIGPARDMLVVLWLLLVAIGFWGPYFAVVIPVNAAHALYAVVLIVALASLLLRFLRRDVPEDRGAGGS